MAKITKVLYEDHCNYSSPGCRAVRTIARGRGLDVVKFSDITKAPLAKRTIVKGQINNVRWALAALGCEQPENIDIPDALRNFAKRKIWKSTLGKVAKTSGATFVKPLFGQKMFHGQIFGGELLNKFGSEFPVLAQERVIFDEEFRVYVLRKKIMGISRYRGWSTPRKQLEKMANEMIAKWKDAPVAHTLDIGTLWRRTGAELALVEVNDGFSCGKYDGITQENYYQMVEARWKELVGL
jgi:hypothetical protein